MFKAIYLSFFLINIKIITIMNWMLIPSSGEEDVTGFPFFLGFLVVCEKSLPRGPTKWGFLHILYT